MKSLCHFTYLINVMYSRSNTLFVQGLNIITIVSLQCLSIVRNLIIYLFIYLFILYLKLTIIKTGTIVCSSKNSYAAKEMLIYLNYC